MLVKVTEWIAGQREELKRWADGYFGTETDKAEIATNVITGLFVVVLLVPGVALAWLALSLLIAVIQQVGQGLATGVSWALERVADWNLTEVITKPVHDYITVHAAGLPAGAEAIWSVWTLTGPILWLICWLTKSWGARLAWLLYGAGTVAMVYSASPAGGQLLAAGVAVLYWAVLSVFALRGIGRRPVVHVHSAPDVTTPLQQLRQQLDEIRTRIARMEVAGDELAAGRAGSQDDEDF
ncbi:hypothetical protein [Streptosporangium canum]|uniref:hypothetical protein n=1 Tax=Streptosporangium canum TaxID=324952 RepID=UPI0037B83C80